MKRDASAFSVLVWAVTAVMGLAVVAGAPSALKGCDRRAPPLPDPDITDVSVWLLGRDGRTVGLESQWSQSMVVMQPAAVPEFSRIEGYLPTDELRDGKAWEPWLAERASEPSGSELGPPPPILIGAGGEVWISFYGEVATILHRDGRLALVRVRHVKGEGPK